jgi:hypothetical protein
VLLLLLAATPGCRKKELTPNEIRAITREMVFAAQKAAGASGQRLSISTRPEYAESNSRSRQEAAARPPGAGLRLVTDHLYVSIPANPSAENDVPILGTLEDELRRVAFGHGLRRVRRPSGNGGLRINLFFRDRLTHAVHVIRLVARRRAAPVLNYAEARPGDAGAGGLRLAIILDDLGYDRAGADAVFTLPFPLTVAVLPHHARSAEIAEEAYLRGYQVLLHLPMESANGEAKAEPVELRTGQTPEEVTRALLGMLGSVPHVAGVNNHQGSRATADRRLMAALMPLLRERELFFIDSRTTGASVALDAARAAGVPAASRSIFLDDTPTRDFTLRQLEAAAAEAERRGSAIAIGHPYPSTLEVLQAALARLEARGIRLVYASELVR